MTRITRSQVDREFFAVSKIFSQNAQSQINDNEQKTQILNQKDNFHVNLDINVVDSKKQRVINKTQTSQRNNVDTFSNNASCSFRNEKTSILRNVFEENIIRVLNKMSSARASEATRLAKFALWSKNSFKSILHNEREKLIKDLDFYQIKNQHELNIFFKKCVQVFKIRFVTYGMNIDRVQYA